MAEVESIASFEKFAPLKSKGAAGGTYVYAPPHWPRAALRPMLLLGGTPPTDPVLHASPTAPGRPAATWTPSPASSPARGSTASSIATRAESSLPCAAAAVTRPPAPRRRVPRPSRGLGVLRVYADSQRGHQLCSPLSPGARSLWRSSPRTSSRRPSSSAPPLPGEHASIHVARLPRVTAVSPPRAASGGCGRHASDLSPLRTTAQTPDTPPLPLPPPPPPSTSGWRSCSSGWASSSTPFKPPKRAVDSAASEQEWRGWPPDHCGQMHANVHLLRPRRCQRPVACTG